MLAFLNILLKAAARQPRVVRLQVTHWAHKELLQEDPGSMGMAVLQFYVGSDAVETYDHLTDETIIAGVKGTDTHTSYHSD